MSYGNPITKNFMVDLLNMIKESLFQIDYTYRYCLKCIFS